MNQMSEAVAFRYVSMRDELCLLPDVHMPCTPVVTIAALARCR